ncbi:MAG: methyltransferase domain-containing protein [Anaerolineales bacterium]|nr:methyltransferase domain-containing protein [Anaerolineales bacterium]
MNVQQSVSSRLYDKDYFLTACEGFQEFIDSEGEQLSRRLAEAFAVAGIKEGMRVLDVGSGRGEIVRQCARLGAHAYGIDFSTSANILARELLTSEIPGLRWTGVIQSDAKYIPFPSNYFDRVLMFDIVEHLYPQELYQALREVRRVLKINGRLIVHTAPNRWYDRFAYPWVRFYRTLSGEGDNYPANPREITPVNLHVHVNEQDILSMSRVLRRAGFSSKVWLDSPPQSRQEGIILHLLRSIAFGIPPFRWFFEREVFAVAWKKAPSI